MAKFASGLTAKKSQAARGPSVPPVIFASNPKARPSNSKTSVSVYCRRIHMQRRDFILSSSAALAASSFGGYFVNAQEKKRRVGLIGCGWYGKSDICRLI